MQTMQIKMRLLYSLFLMVILSPAVMTTLWKLDSKENIKETVTPQNETVKESVDSEEPLIPEVKLKEDSCLKSSGYELTVLKQFIGKLLNQFQPHMTPGKDEEKVEFYMKMKLSALDLSRIALFMDKNEDIYEVEEVLTSMLGDVSSDELLSKLPMTLYEKYSSYAVIITPTIFVLFLYLSLKFMHLQSWVIIKWILFQVFVISVIWNWYFLYQENYTKYTTAIEKGIPEKCKENYKAGFFESISSSFLEMLHVPIDECEQYHLITSIPPGLRVPPTEAISFCIVNTLLKPLASIGENIGLFFQKLSRQVPFPILIISVIFILIVLLFTIVICNGYTIGGIFISLTPPQPKEPDDSKEIKEKLDRVMEVLDHFQDIREILLKKPAVENQPVLGCIANQAGAGDGFGIQESQPDCKPV